LVAFDGHLTVGWCQLTPRDALPWLDRMWWFQRVDDVPVSDIVFFRAQGLSSARGNVSAYRCGFEDCKACEGTALEAYPVDMSAPKCTSNIFTGTVSAFARAGFREVARRAAARPIMRHDLKAVAR
jgi:hypothetical protein